MRPSAWSVLRGHLLANGRGGDATLVSVLAYAGLKPGEALALTWSDVRDRTIMEMPANPAKPSNGLEPLTPSLPFSAQTLAASCT